MTTDTATTPETQAPAADIAPAKAESKGRQMAFVENEDGTIKVEFGPGLDPLQFSPAALPEALIPQALADGIMYRLRSVTSKLIGDDRTPEKLRAAIERGIQTIFVDGEWRIERAPGDPGANISQEAEAAWIFRKKRAEAAGKDVSTVGDLVQSAREFAALSDEQKKMLKAQPLYKVALAEVKARHAAANAAKLAAAAAKESENANPDALAF